MILLLNLVPLFRSFEKVLKNGTYVGPVYVKGGKISFTISRDIEELVKFNLIITDSGKRLLVTCEYLGAKTPEVCREQCFDIVAKPGDRDLFIAGNGKDVLTGRIPGIIVPETTLCAALERICLIMKDLGVYRNPKYWLIPFGRCHGWTYYSPEVVHDEMLGDCGVIECDSYKYGAAAIVRK